MTYRLLGSLTSPFVRRLRLYMADIPYEFEIVNYLESGQDARLSAANPLKRIPIVV
ncbi:MAG TPA: glutathione S-transferase N-terminal domain-containing protein [Pseudomonadota bacterium]|nr:glutathione S-transferase N-terminal domain-containing protein [Pseudomonadota bacterium]